MRVSRDLDGRARILAYASGTRPPLSTPTARAGPPFAPLTWGFVPTAHARIVYVTRCWRNVTSISAPQDVLTPQRFFASIRPNASIRFAVRLSCVRFCRLDLPHLLVQDCTLPTTHHTRVVVVGDRQRDDELSCEDAAGTYLEVGVCTRAPCSAEGFSRGGVEVESHRRLPLGYWSCSESGPSSQCAERAGLTTKSTGRRARAKSVGSASETRHASMQTSQNARGHGDRW